MQQEPPGKWSGHQCDDKYDKYDKYYEYAMYDMVLCISIGIEDLQGLSYCSAKTLLKISYKH